MKTIRVNVTKVDYKMLANDDNLMQIIYHHSWNNSTSLNLYPFGEPKKGESVFVSAEFMKWYKENIVVLEGVQLPMPEVLRTPLIYTDNRSRLLYLTSFFKYCVESQLIKIPLSIIVEDKIENPKIIGYDYENKKNKEPLVYDLKFIQEVIKLYNTGRNCVDITQELFQENSKEKNSNIASSIRAILFHGSNKALQPHIKENLIDIEKWNDLNLQREIKQNYEIDAKGCWNYKGFVDEKTRSQPYIRVNNQYVNLRRLIYEFHKKSLTSVETLLSVCQNARCLNPDHYEILDLVKNAWYASKLGTEKTILKAIEKNKINNLILLYNDGYTIREAVKALNDNKRNYEQERYFDIIKNAKDGIKGEIAKKIISDQKWEEKRKEIEDVNHQKELWKQFDDILGRLLKCNVKEPSIEVTEEPEEKKKVYRERFVFKITNLTTGKIHIFESYYKLAKFFDKTQSFIRDVVMGNKCDKDNYNGFKIEKLSPDYNLIIDEKDVNYRLTNVQTHQVKLFRNCEEISNFIGVSVTAIYYVVRRAKKKNNCLKYKIYKFEDLRSQIKMPKTKKVPKVSEPSEALPQKKGISSRKKIKVTDLKTGKFKIFESQAKTARAFGISDAYIMNVLRGNNGNKDNFRGCKLEEIE